MQFCLYNTLTQKKEELHPLQGNYVRLYVCGPTVYDRAHIGNFRPVVVFDTLYRTLKRFYQVTYVRNITDVDDKIITAASQNNEPIETLTIRTTQMYHEDTWALNALSPDHEPRATQFIPQMIVLIQSLIERGFAYEAENHVLFHVEKFSKYGALSKRSTEDMLAGARVEIAPYKKSPFDFVLWKPSTDTQPGWESPWGRGRPGWHIECSAMSEAYLGIPFDIHGGGADLQFPHHENEIAQSCCAHNLESYAKTWMHNGMLLVNGQKMSKSLGNFFTVRDKLAELPGEVIRAVLLSAHYRQSLDWTEEIVTQMQKFVDRLYQSLRGKFLDFHNDVSSEILSALGDDLNTPLALRRLYDLSSEINTKGNPYLCRLLVNSANLLGLLFQEPDQWFQKGADSQHIENLILQRAKAKQEKNFAEADRIREQLKNMGIILEDGSQGTTWKRQ